MEVHESPGSSQLIQVCVPHRSGPFPIKTPAVDDGSTPFAGRPRRDHPISGA